MPIQSDRVDSDEFLELSHWSVGERDALVTMVAHLAAGRFLHVEKLIRQEEGVPPAHTDSAIDAAIAKLDCAGLKPEDPKRIHRDGWLFQFISWVSSVKEFPDGLVKAPHPRPSNKGTDGFILCLADSVVNAVVISEDKATDSPRDTVRDDVWPEFGNHENGLKDDELVSDTETLLSRAKGIDPARVAYSSGWLTSKRYRASVATSAGKIPPKVAVFEGYDTAVAGEGRTRMANLFMHENMRGFLEDLSREIIAKLDGLRPAP